MSGEVKSYNLSRPMKYVEYKSMPDDLRRQYILSLEDKYNAGSSAIGKMFGVTPKTMSTERARLGLPPKRKGGSGKPAPEWYSFLKYGTPPREASAVKDLIPPELREKLDRYEQEHPHVKANVERIREENAVDETDAPIISESQPVGYVLTASDAMMLSNVRGTLLAISATADNPPISGLLNALSEDVQRLVTAWMEVQG